jgi:hypothetical protein
MGRENKVKSNPKVKGDYRAGPWHQVVGNLSAGEHSIFQATQIIPRMARIISEDSSGESLDNKGELGPRSNQF